MRLLRVALSRGAALALSFLSVGCARDVEFVDPGGGAGGAGEVIAGGSIAEARAASSGVERVDCPGPGGWTATITTSGDAFSPAKVVVVPGHIIEFMPSESDPDHALVADDGSFESGAPGATACFRFERSGTYAFHCALHPDEMRGVVIVK
jgi:plastocyanin